MLIVRSFIRIMRVNKVAVESEIAETSRITCVMYSDISMHRRFIKCFF